VPMFLFAQTAPTWPLRGLGPTAVAGLLIHSTGLLAGHRLTILVGGGLLAIAGTLVVVQLGLWFHHRVRRIVDPAVGYLIAAAGFLAVTIVAGVLRLTGSFDPRGWAAYAVLVLLGWCLLFTVGISHRIVPFLSWLHLFGGKSRGAHAPPVTALVHTQAAWVSLALLVVGVGSMAVAIQLGQPTAAWFGGAGVAAGIFLIGGQAARGLWLWRRTPLDPPPERSTPPRPPGRTLEVLT